MENFFFQRVSFSYPEQKKKALQDISFQVKQGEFVIFCGPSGCGKSTLLRHFKTCVTPVGSFSGNIFFQGIPLKEVDDRTQSQEIGFVFQSPENQVVTDKVWHELAFGLESLGYDTPVIRRRVAEIAAFFGIENWFYKNVAQLSGGQKQILSLASVMAMNPKILVLDEPTSQLDPIAASDFLSLLGKINRELGITILLVEHRLEEAFSLASRVIVMEQGKILCNDIPTKVGLHLRESGNGMFLAMPVAMRVWASLETKLECPITVGQGSDFLTARKKEKEILPLIVENETLLTNETILTCEEIWFRYEKHLPDVVKGCSLTLQKGECYTILGGNGTGKTTFLKIIAGLFSVSRGSISKKGNIVMLPQNPQALFLKATVREDLSEMLREKRMTKEEKDRKLQEVETLCKLSGLQERHPYDLSGGEQQRMALAKILLTDPDILLLDEPTKGFDAEFQEVFGKILKNLMEQGVAILMVSHDVVFSARYANRCGLFFDGNLVAEGTPREFFGGNRFYTTPANRMARHLIPDAITMEDILFCCDGKKRENICEKEALDGKEEIFQNRNENFHEKETVDGKEVFYKGKKSYQDENTCKGEGFLKKPLSIWRKIIAVLSGSVAFGVFLYATSITNLSELIRAFGISEMGKEHLFLYIILFAALSILLIAIGRRSEPPFMEQNPKEKRNLSKRTVAASVVILISIPITLFICIFYLDHRHYLWIAVLILFQCMLPFLLVFEGRKPKSRELVTVAVLSGISIAGRSLFFMLPQFKPVLAMTIVSGIAMGGETGFVVGAITMLASNMLFSQGPWTPWQMFAMGICGFLAGVLFQKGWLLRTRVSMSIFGALVAVLIYGGIMNPAAVVMFSPESITIKTLAAYYITGLPMDLVHAFGTVLFLMLAGEPMLKKMDRIKTKYGFYQ